MARTRATWKCRWVPRRTKKRDYTVNDAARIVCRVVRSGKSKAQIDKRYAVICAGERDDSRAVEDALAQAQALALSNSDALQSAYELFLLINGLLLGLLALPSLLRRAPLLVIAFRGVARAQTSAAAQVTVIGRQIAANDSFYTNVTVLLRRLAA